MTALTSMNAVVRPADLDGLRETSELVDALVASGAISPQERTKLLNQAWAESCKDTLAASTRLQTVPTATNLNPSFNKPVSSSKEPQMQNNLFNELDRQHALIQRHLTSLSSVSPTLNQPIVLGGDVAQNASTLLRAGVQAQMQAAAHALEAIMPPVLLKPVTKNADVVIDVETVLKEPSQ